jgi:nucleoside-diphosphate-sugar epimerase
VARIVIVGCGCRGRTLARALVADDHAVRGTTRGGAAARAEIEAAGAEPYVGDPDRIGTIVPAFDGATIVVWLLGSAHGSPEQLSALHGGRLEMLLLRVVDTTVRGLVYEAAGSVDAAVLSAGAETVRAACERSRIPLSVLIADPTRHHAWLVAAHAAVAELLA